MNYYKFGTVLSKSLPTTTAHILVNGEINYYRLHTLKDQDINKLIEEG